MDEKCDVSETGLPRLYDIHTSERREGERHEDASMFAEHHALVATDDRLCEQAMFYRTRTGPVQPVRKRRARQRRNKPESSDSDDAVEKRPDVDVQDLGVQKRLDVDVDIQKRLDVVEQELGAKSMEVVEQDICAEKSMEMDEKQFQFKWRRDLMS